MLNEDSTKVIVYIASCFLFVFILIIFILMILYKYNNKRVAYYKNIEILKFNHETAILQSQIEIQEQTFQNISREIHDNIVQNLGLAKLYLKNIDTKYDQSNLNVIHQSVELIADSINNLGDLSRSMSAESLLKEGLITAVKFKLNQINKAGNYATKLEVIGNTYYLDKNIELVIFRIIQEALNNILKHAEATIISIQLVYKPEKIDIKISDNGKGFSFQDRDITGIGLRNMQSRSRILGGDCKIHSMPLEGTLITLNIPNNA